MLNRKVLSEQRCMKVGLDKSSSSCRAEQRMARGSKLQGKTCGGKMTSNKQDVEDADEGCTDRTTVDC